MSIEAAEIDESDFKSPQSAINDEFFDAKDEGEIFSAYLAFRGFS